MGNDDNRYRTSDLYYAAFLKVAGVPYLDAQEQRGPDGKLRVYFYFEVVEGMKELKAGYFSRSVNVPAMTYADEIKAMKALTHMED
jgi:hypothetical protein